MPTALYVDDPLTTGRLHACLGSPMPGSTSMTGGPQGCATRGPAHETTGQRRQQAPILNHSLGWCIVGRSWPGPPTPVHRHAPSMHSMGSPTRPKPLGLHVTRALPPLSLQFLPNQTILPPLSANLCLSDALTMCAMTRNSLTLLAFTQDFLLRGKKKKNSLPTSHPPKECLINEKINCIPK